MNASERWGRPDVSDKKKGTCLADERRKGRMTIDRVVLTNAFEYAFFDPRRDDEGGYAIQKLFFKAGARDGKQRKHESDVPDTKSIKVKHIVLPILCSFCVDQIVAWRDANGWRYMVRISLFSKIPQGAYESLHQRGKKGHDARRVRQRRLERVCHPIEANYEVLRKRFLSTPHPY